MRPRVPSDRVTAFPPGLPRFGNRRNRMNKRVAWAAAFLLAAGGAWAAGDVWMTDFDAAK